MASRPTRGLALIAAALLAGAAGCGGAARDAKETREVAGFKAPALDPADTALLDDLEKRTFDFFWQTANPKNGLVPDRAPTRPFSSIAAVGFALTAYPIGVERGYITRAQARERVRVTLKFFRDAPMGDQKTGVTGYKGFYYHFLDMETGLRFQQTELSTVDTALLLGGVVFSAAYFTAPDPEEAEIRQLAQTLLDRTEWTWAQPRPPTISMGWTPEHGFIEWDWKGYNEAMIVYLLALASPTFPIAAESWQAWTADYDRTWGTHHGQEHLGFPPLFGHQYSHVWVDFRGIKDAYMQRRGIDYFENSRRATLAQRAYAIANPNGWKDYGEDVWGLTACDGPGEFERAFGGKPRKFMAYSARGGGTWLDGNPVTDDGTIAPTAMLGSIPFAPEIVLPGLRALRKRYGDAIYGTYGFFDSFNPSFTFANLSQLGPITEAAGWVSKDYLGIDQGPILAMLDNYRTGMVWRVMRTSAYLRRGLARAGFTGGWLDATVGSAASRVPFHPDRRRVASRVHPTLHRLEPAR
jgi:hypothetical protein